MVYLDITDNDDVKNQITFILHIQGVFWMRALREHSTVGGYVDVCIERTLNCGWVCGGVH